MTRSRNSGMFQPGHLVNRKHGQANLGGTKHRPTKSYSAWNSMLQRCENPKHKSYHRYGARGITVCSEWHKFERFFSDMGEAPKGLSLERKKNDLGYSKMNCMWATPLQQMQNTSIARRITFRHETYCVAEWARRRGIVENTLRARLNAGWSVERALTP